MSLFNVNNSSRGGVHLLLLSNDISPVNKPYKLYGFSEHFANLDNTVFRNVVSNNNSFFVVVSISSKSATSNNFSFNNVVTSSSKVLS